MTGGMGFRACSAQRQSEAGHVRFGSKADIGHPPIDVRFAPKSRHKELAPSYVRRNSSGSFATLAANVVVLFAFVRHPSRSSIGAVFAPRIEGNGGTRSAPMDCVDHRLEYLKTLRR